MSFKRVFVALGVVGLALATSSFVSPGAGAGDGINDAGPATEASSTNCRTSFGGGTGSNHFSWCINEVGAIPHLQYPIGKEHIFVGGVFEGYMVCVGGAAHASEFMFSGSGWGAPSYPAANKVVRSSSLFRLEQTFTHDAVNRLATITMKLTNISGASQPGVQLARFVDFDMNGTPSGDIYVSAFASFWASDIVGVALSATNFTVPRTTVVTSAVVPTSCSPTPVASPATGDRLAGVIYTPGNMAAGASKTVTFRYTRL